MSARSLLRVTLVCLTSCRTPPHQSVPVRLAVTRGSLLSLPVYLAESLGFFQQEGLSVTLQETVSAPKSLQSLLGGSTDVVGGGYLQVMRMAAEGRALQAFRVMQRYPGFAVIVSPRASRRIDRIEDLKGANVGTSPGSDYQALLSYLLVQPGLSPEMAEAARRVLSATIEGCLLSRLDLKRRWQSILLNLRLLLPRSCDACADVAEAHNSAQRDAGTGSCPISPDLQPANCVGRVPQAE